MGLRSHRGYGCGNFVLEAANRASFCTCARFAHAQQSCVTEPAEAAAFSNAACAPERARSAPTLVFLTCAGKLLVADTTAAVAECAASYGDELPIIARRVEREFEDAPGGAVAHFAVGNWRIKTTQERAARADDERVNAIRKVGVGIGVLWREALVIMIMPIQNDIGACRVERLPKCSIRCIVAMRA